MEILSLPSDTCSARPLDIIIYQGLKMAGGGSSNDVLGFELTASDATSIFRSTCVGESGNTEVT